MRLLPFRAVFTLLFALAFVVAMIGCGGDVASSSNPPSAPAPSPGTGAGGSGSGGSGSTADPAGVQYHVSLLSPSGVTSNNGGTVGQFVEISNNGDIRIDSTGNNQRVTYTVQFCPYPATTFSSCMDLGTFTTGSSGNSTFTTHFPKSGNWAGIFRIRDGNNIQTETAGSTTTFNASVMQWVSAANGVGSSYPGSGTLTVANGMAHVNLRGVAPNTTYNFTVSYMGGSSSYQVGSITTDASGNATADISLTNSGAAAVAIFSLSSSNGGYTSGFHVP